MRPVSVGAAALVSLGIVVGVSAQQGASGRSILQKADISVPGHEVVETVVNFPARVSTGRHSHPGEMVGYVLEGSFVVEQDGKAATTLTVGESIIIPVGVAHNITNSGRTLARMLSTYIVEKDKPLNTPLQ
jgi:quercetin dioxygenase-like cupin family protein